MSNSSNTDDERGMLVKLLSATLYGYSYREVKAKGGNDLTQNERAFDQRQLDIIMEYADKYAHKAIEDLLIKARINENKRYIGEYNGTIAALSDEEEKPSIVQKTVSTLIKDFYARTEELEQQLTKNGDKV